MSRTPGERVKTLAIRLDEDLHAQLSFIAQLSGTSITDEIRRAIEAHLAAARSNAELTARAGAMLEEIERDAQARQQAIASLFGQAASEMPEPPASSARKPGRGSSDPKDEGSSAS